MLTLIHSTSTSPYANLISTTISYNRRFVNITAQVGAGGKRRMNRASQSLVRSPAAQLTRSCDAANPEGKSGS